MKKLTILALIVILPAVLLSFASCAKTSTTTTGPASSTSTSTSASTPAAKAVILRIGVTYPEADPHGKYTLVMVDSFNKRTGGRYVMEPHLGTTIVKLEESLDAVRTGAIEMSINPIGPFSAADPRFGASEICFLANNIQSNIEQANALMPDFSSIYETKFNQKALAINPMGAMEVLGVKKPIKTVADWKGLTVQAVSPATSDAIQAMGGAPVTISPVEGYSAMQKGVVDGSLFPLDAVLAMNFFEVAKYVTVTYFSPAVNIVVVNLDVWNKMPKDVQDILVDECKKLQTNLDDAFTQSMTNTPKVLESKGVTIYYLPKAERDKWSALVLPSQIKNFLDPTGDFGKRVLQVADAANAHNPYQY